MNNISNDSAVDAGDDAAADPASDSAADSAADSSLPPARGFTRLRALAFATLVAGSICGSTSLGAQGFPPSQRGSVMQNIAITQVTVVYGRPVARGRPLFGALVPWDTIWHPGADSASRVTFDQDVLINQHAVARGTYSLWLIPRAAGPWTVILSKASHVFHTEYAGPPQDALRVDVVPDTLSYMESMAIYFPKVLRDEGQLRIHWGTLAVTLDIKAPYRRE